MKFNTGPIRNSTQWYISHYILTWAVFWSLTRITAASFCLLSWCLFVVLEPVCCLLPCSSMGADRAKLQTSGSTSSLLIAPYWALITFQLRTQSHQTYLMGLLLTLHLLWHKWVQLTEIKHFPLFIVPENRTKRGIEVSGSILSYLLCV